MLLIGDSIHNIADGVVIASAFSIDPTLGIATTIGIALHELPQEIAEFGVLLHAGYSRLKAALLNGLSALSILVGVGLTFVFKTAMSDALFIVTGLAAGNLLYIATSDLIPELRSSHRDHFWQTFLSTLAGTLLIFGILELGGAH